MPAFLFSFCKIKLLVLKKALFLLSFFSLLPLILSFSWQTAASSDVFDQTNCKGSARAEQICRIKENEGVNNTTNLEEGVEAGTFQAEGTKIMSNGKQIGTRSCPPPMNGACTYKLNSAYDGMGAYTSEAAGNAKEAVEGEKACPDAKNYAISCCTDPMTCLGGEALSTANEVGSVVTAVGPGLGMALQGGGKDMSGMCKAMQALAGTGASLSTAAHMKCKGSISSCQSSCDRDIAKACNDYVTAKNECRRLMATASSAGAFAQSIKTTAETNFKIKGEPPTTQIIIPYNDQIKPQCLAQKPKAGQLAENIGQMANSAISAELCKQQASLIDGRESCQEAGGRWNGYDCDTSAKDECIGKGGQWENNFCNNSTEQSCLAYGGRWINNQCDTSQADRCLADGGKWIDGQCQLDEARCLAEGGKWEHRRCIMSQTDPADPDTAERDVCLADGGRWLNNQCDTSEQDRCVEDGGQWINGYCSLDEARCVADGGTWELRRCNMAAADSSGGNNDSGDGSDGNGDGSGTQFTVNDAPDDPVGGNNPPGASSGIGLQREAPPNPDDDDANNVGGGGTLSAGITSPGSSDFGGGIGVSGSSSGSSDFDSDGSSTKSGSSGGKSTGGSSGRSGGRFGGFGGGGSYRGGFGAKRSPYRAARGSSGNFGNMGGGGFSGYSGGGGADDSDDYAGLGLSKKKMKELEKKQGAKRKTASESGGAHQNIFERISKRFQSLCQNRLDCR